MNITDVRIRRIDEDGKMRGIASITLDDEFVVHDIKIVNGRNGLFIAMPCKKIGENYRDIAHPLSPEARDKIEHAIITEYQEALDRRSQELTGIVLTDTTNGLCETAEKQD